MARAGIPMMRRGWGRVGVLALMLVSLASCGRDEANGSRRQVEASRAALLQQIEANPKDADLQVELARLSFELRDGIGAEAALRRALDRGGDAARIRPLLARAIAMQGDAARALGLLNEGPVAPDMTGQAAHIAANIYLDQGNMDAARTAFDAAIRAAPLDARLWVDVARFRNANADGQGARDAVDYALELDADASEALAFKANLVRAQEGMAAALDWYDAALDRDPDNVGALFDQAATLGDMGRYGDMLTAVRRAAKLAPNDPRIYYLQAVLAARAENYQLARSLLQRTRGKMDEVPGFRLLSAIVELQLGGAAVAASQSEQLLADQPHNQTARRVLAIANWADGDSDGAADALAPLVARRDADSWSLNLAARVAAEQGNPGEAAILLRRAAALVNGPVDAFAETDPYGILAAAANAEPLDPAAAVPAIRAEMANGNAASALARAARLRDANRGVAAAQILLGDTALAANDLPLAIRAFREARALDAGEGPALRLAGASMRAGDPAGMVAAIRGLARTDPGSLAGERLAGHLAMDMQQWDIAIAHFMQVRRRIGDRDAVIMEQLARAWRAKGDPGRALPFAWQAYRLQPLNPAIMRLLADLLAGSGDRQTAQDLRDKAVAISVD